MDKNKKDKLWEIAINIDSCYIEKIFKQKCSILIERNNLIQIDFNTFSIKKDGQILLERKSESDFWQLIRIYYFLDILKFENEIIYSDKEFDISKKKFIDKLTKKPILFSPINNEYENIYEHIAKFLEQFIKNINFMKNYKDEENPFEVFKLFHTIFIIILYENSSVNVPENKVVYDFIKDSFLKYTKNFKDNVLNSFLDFYNNIQQYLDVKDILEKLKKFYISKEYAEINDIQNKYNNWIDSSKRYNNNSLTTNNRSNFNNVIKSEAKNLYSFIYGINSNHTNEEYFIPIYQRKYVWDEKNIKDLLIDIKNAKNYSSHYIGQILISSADNKLNIVDGQQRMSTLFLILKALLYKIKSDDLENKLRLEGYILENIDHVEYFLNSYSPKITEKFKRINGNSDFENFNKLWSNERIEKNNLIHNNFIFIIKWINLNLLDLKTIWEFWNSLLNNIFFVETTLYHFDHFDVFEKMNTRSEPLNVIDLLKTKYLIIQKKIFRIIIQ